MTRATALGVPPGIHMRDLKLGRSITLDNGVVVTPDQIVDEVDAAVPVLLVDCPSLNHVPAIAAHPRVVSLPRAGKEAALVMHMSPAHIVNSVVYQDWMTSLGPDIRHLVLSDTERCNTPLPAAAFQRTLLNSIHPVVFPLPSPDAFAPAPTSHLSAGATEGAGVVGANTTELASASTSADLPVAAADPPTEATTATTATTDSVSASTAAPAAAAAAAATAPRVMHEYPPRPKDMGINTTPLAARTPAPTLAKIYVLPARLSGLELESIALVNLPAVRSRVKACPGFKEAHSALTAADAALERPAAAEPELHFLGTGSSMPSKYRNVSAILLRVPALGTHLSMLLDCGEGTYGQLSRQFGSQLDELIFNLRCVHISHMHADHHLGLVRILLARDALHPPSPLVVFGPPVLDLWLKSFADIHPLSYIFVNTHRTRGLQTMRDTWALGDLGFTKIDNVPVEHCRHAFGVVLHHRAGWKLVYSGDTRPCQNLVSAGRDADVLIHEATFDNDLADDAVFKMHSTTAEAVEVGRAMGARATILTHFSQRYPKVPVFDAGFTDTTSVAFDNMRVPFSYLPLLPRLVPAIRAVFDETYKDIEEENDLDDDDVPDSKDKSKKSKGQGPKEKGEKKREAEEKSGKRGKGGQGAKDDVKRPRVEGQ